MIKIDKEVTAEIGDIYLRLSNRCWNGSDSKYYGLEYGNSSIQNIKKELVSQQRNLCCYCLQNIEIEDSTIEHIIPQKHNNTFEEYVFANSEHIIDRSAWNDTVLISNASSCVGYPHDISFFNLVSSCNDTKSCNSQRKNKIIPIPFFDINLHTRATYSDKGVLGCLDPYDVIYDVINECNLNNLNLTSYRLIWKVIKEKNVGSLLSYGLNRGALETFINDDLDRFDDIIYEAAVATVMVLKKTDIISQFYKTEDVRNIHFDNVRKFSYFYFIF